MISEEEIKKTTELARIGASEEEIKGLAKDAENILKYVSQISEVASEDAEEKVLGPVYNVLREDQNPHYSEEYKEELLHEAPNREGDWIKVKKILGD